MTKEFIKLENFTKEEARVLIAKDVLMQLDAKKIIATKGSYLEFTDSSWREEDFLHEVMERNICQVCALGSLYYSRVQLANETKCDVVNKYNEFGIISNCGVITPDLLQYFERDALRDIEVYFEGWYGAVKFADENPDPEMRMRKIMQNIIDNNGTFVTEKL